MIRRISKVRKRDGRLVSFDESKIADAVHKAGCAVGNDDRFLADELSGVVTLFLEKSHAGGVPGIEEIQDMVEKVLIETGHARMAKAYILYREKRARARERVTVHGDMGGGPMVGNPTKAVVSPWSKARIAEALVREADLDERIASEVAARVEEKVFTARVPRITTAAIRSLVEAELFLMEYGDRVGRQALVGLPRFDVGRLLHGGKDTHWRPTGPRDLKRAVADSVLAQYAMAEIYSAEVADAHMDGRIHILDAGCPFEWVGASLELPPVHDPETWVEATALHLGRIGGMVTREVALHGLLDGAGRWEEGDGRPTALLAARRLFGHAGLRMLDRRGGRLRVALCLPVLPSDPGEAKRDAQAAAAAVEHAPTGVAEEAARGEQRRRTAVA
ncbi:MAG: ATP cone domain-containing protein, partial [Planctomycetota bacterium]